MSADALAAIINDAHLRGDCLVREGWDKVLLSRLSADLTRTIADLATAAELDPAIFDDADNDVALADVDDIGGPYRVSLSKPAAEGSGYVLTLRGLDDLLNDLGSRTAIHVATVTTAFETLAAVVAPWKTSTGPVAIPGPASLKSPRNFVREYGDQRLAPASIGLWLLRDPTWLGEEPVFIRWAILATRQCLLAVGNEVEDGPVSVVFKGPPRGAMVIPDAATVIGEALFSAVQACARWVYETATETEMRHPLLSAEIARFSTIDGTLKADPAILVPALDGARLAYDLGMSKLSSDTLKMLTDLRKSVLDEATKVSDNTRQLVASVATTLSVGVGLVAAKVGANADGRIIGAVALIATVYVMAIIRSGYRALALQDDIREQWKPRTYGFISGENYDTLVDGPARTAAASYRAIARTSLYLTLAMFGAVIWSIAKFP